MKGQRGIHARSAENKVGRETDRVKNRSRSMVTCPYGVGFPGGSDGEASACNAGDQGSIPGSGRSPGEGNGNPLQYSCLENSMDGGAWWPTVPDTNQTRLSNFTGPYGVLRPQHLGNLTRPGVHFFFI